MKNHYDPITKNDMYKNKCDYCIYKNFDMYDEPCNHCKLAEQKI